jgi:predicted lysophospholipase L1 biosynthesis ABC-type transport system permease subunit
MDFRVRPGELEEDQLTALLESYSARWPTSLFMGAAIASIVGSLVLKSQKKDLHALFIGQWAAPFLILGLYNKMVKQHGSDTRREHGPHGKPEHGPGHEKPDPSPSM